MKVDSGNLWKVGCLTLDRYLDAKIEFLEAKDKPKPFMEMSALNAALAGDAEIKAAVAPANCLEIEAAELCLRTLPAMHG